MDVATVFAHDLLSGSVNRIGIARVSGSFQNLACQRVRKHFHERHGQEQPRPVAEVVPAIDIMLRGGRRGLDDDLALVGIPAMNLAVGCRTSL
jgi:hypothetical protein